MATLRILARQSRLQGATDLTHYGEGRASSKASLTHHVANISTAILDRHPSSHPGGRRRLGAQRRLSSLPSDPLSARAVTL